MRTKKKKGKEEKRARRRGQRCQRECLIGVCECVCRCSTCDSEKRGQIEQGSGLLVGRGAVGDALLDERQTVRSQTHWEGERREAEGGGRAVRHDPLITVFNLEKLQLMIQTMWCEWWMQLLSWCPRNSNSVSLQRRPAPTMHCAMPMTWRGCVFEVSLNNYITWKCGKQIFFARLSEDKLAECFSHFLLLLTVQI